MPSTMRIITSVVGEGNGSRSNLENELEYESFFKQNM